MSVIRFSDNEKIAIVDRYLKGETVQALVKEFKVPNSVIYSWRDKFRPGQAPAGAPAPQGSTPPRAQPSESVIAMRDAISYLKHAKAEMHAALQAGRIKEFDRSHLYALLALNSLLGEP